MGLGLPTGGDGGAFVPYCKWNSKAGRFYKKTDDGDKEVKNLTAIFDLHGIKTGNFKFMAGQAPVSNFDSSVGACDAEGGEGFKRGFYVLLYAEKALGGLREFSSNAGACNDGMNDLYAAFEAAPEAKAGKYPVVKLVDGQAIESQHGTNFKPVFEIVKWVDDPGVFNSNKSGNGSASQSESPESSASPSDDDDEEF